MKGKIGIYKIENLANGKVYIGQSKNIEKRFIGHCRYSKNSHLGRAISKYGASNFKLHILETFSSYDKEKLNDRECYWIYVFKSYNNEFGYNKTFGGEGVNPTKETLVNMSRASKARNYKHTPQALIYFREKSTNSRWITDGKVEYFKIIDNSFFMPIGFHFGRLPRSEVAKEKTSASLKETYRNTDECIKKERAEVTRQRLKGHYVSEETRKKISLKNKEFYKNNPEVKNRLNLVHRGKIFITNGIEDRIVLDISEDDLKNGWFVGKSKVIYINNGIRNIRISKLQDLPLGWTYGKLKKGNLEDEA